MSPKLILSLTSRAHRYTQHTSQYIPTLGPEQGTISSSGFPMLLTCSLVRPFVAG